MHDVLNSYDNNEGNSREYATSKTDYEKSESSTKKFDKNYVIDLLGGKMDDDDYTMNY